MSTSAENVASDSFETDDEGPGHPSSEGMAVVEKRLRGNVQYLVLLIAGREHISVNRARQSPLARNQISLPEDVDSLRTAGSAALCAANHGLRRTFSPSTCIVGRVRNRII
jgi:hypothetical protein